MAEVEGTSMGGELARSRAKGAGGGRGGGSVDGPADGGNAAGLSICVKEAAKGDRGNSSSSLRRGRVRRRWFGGKGEVWARKVDVGPSARAASARNAGLPQEPASKEVPRLSSQNVLHLIRHGVFSEALSFPSQDHVRW